MSILDIEFTPEELVYAIVKMPWKDKRNEASD